MHGKKDGMSVRNRSLPACHDREALRNRIQDACKRDQSGCTGNTIAPFSNYLFAALSNSKSRGKNW
jgi:hypothetical protein